MVVSRVFVCSGVPEPFDCEEEVGDQRTFGVGVSPLVDAVVGGAELSA